MTIVTRIVTCPRCAQPARFTGNAADGCPAFVCINSHLIHDPDCGPRGCVRCGERTRGEAMLCRCCAVQS